MSLTAFVTGGSGFVGRNLIKELRTKGWSVKALARSPQSAKVVEDLGAKSVFGDLDNLAALQEGCQEANCVFHLAACVKLEGKWEEFQRDTVEGTSNVIKAAKLAHVPKLVHVSTEAVLIGGPTLINADETWPYPQSPLGFYPKSKGLAEREVVASNDPSNNFETVVIRPRLIWGKGDTVLLPELCKAVQSGKFKWVAGGTHNTSTCHIRNVIEGTMKAYENGKGGNIYFLTDGEPVQYKSFMTRLMATRGVDASKAGYAPYWAAYLGGWFGFVPLTVVRLFGEECTVNDAKARKELGYSNVITMEEGIKELEDEKINL